MAISKHINGKWSLEPFLPGHYEEYEILHDGRTKLLESCHYYKPGDKPSFHPYISWNGEINYDKYSIITIYLSLIGKFIDRLLIKGYTKNVHQKYMDSLIKITLFFYSFDPK